MKQILQEGFPSVIDKIKPVAGGDINQAFYVSLIGGQEFFVKYNSSSLAKDMFVTEMKGIVVLRMGNDKIVPSIHNVKALQIGAMLIMDYYKSISWSPKSYEKLGSLLAQLHQQTNSQYGLEYNNYLGHLDQLNLPKSSFFEFFYECRILPLIRKAVAQNYLSEKYLNWRMESQKTLENIIPIEPPTLIHGDLWSGNILNTSIGPMVIDPSIAYSHREFDLAKTKLFGGFSSDFYGSYQETFPLSPGWKERIDLFQLYPMLAHLIMFGKGYYDSCVRILKKYGK